jgi:hypothetical protein
MKKITDRLAGRRRPSRRRRPAQDRGRQHRRPDHLRLRRGLRLAGAELRRQVQINWMPRPDDRLRHQRGARAARPHDVAPGQGVPQGRDGVPPHQPPARLPDLRPGGRVQAPGAVDRLRPGLLPLHRAEEREAEADAPRAAGHAGRRALHPLLALRPLLQGDRQGRRPRLHRPRQLQHAHLLPGQEAREQLLAQHGRHLPGRRAHEHRFPVQDARLVPQADEQHRHRVSVGANTLVWSREGVIYRITPRQNDAVNDTWMADSGRVLYKDVRARADWLRSTSAAPRARSTLAVRPRGELFAAGGVAVVGSGRSSRRGAVSDEEARGGRRKAKAWLVSRVGEGDRILVSADRNPNVRGALVTGLIRAAGGRARRPGRGDRLRPRQDGRLGRRGPRGAGLTAAQLAKVSVIYLGTQANATSDAAKVVIPTLTVFEKNGTFVNQQFRIQRFAKAVPAARGRDGRPRRPLKAGRRRGGPSPRPADVGEPVAGDLGRRGPGARRP